MSPSSTTARMTGAGGLSLRSPHRTQASAPFGSLGTEQRRCSPVGDRTPDGSVRSGTGRGPGVRPQRLSDAPDAPRQWSSGRSKRAGRIGRSRGLPFALDWRSPDSAAGGGLVGVRGAPSLAATAHRPPPARRRRWGVSAVPLGQVSRSALGASAGSWLASHVSNPLRLIGRILLRGYRGLKSAVGLPSIVPRADAEVVIADAALVSWTGVSLVVGRLRLPVSHLVRVADAGEPAHVRVSDSMNRYLLGAVAHLFPRRAVSAAETRAGGSFDDCQRRVHADPGLAYRRGLVRGLKPGRR